MERLKAWLTRFQEHQRLQRLRRQWRLSGLVARAECLPLEVLLRIQLHDLAACAAARSAPMVWFPALWKRWKRIARKIGIGKRRSARRTPPRCPAWPGQWKVRLRRRAMVWALCRLLQILRWYLGRRIRSSRSSISCSRAVEAVTVQQIATRAARARLPGELIKEIEADAKWSAPARKALEISAPQLSAKWLNKFGVSAENQPEIVFATAVTTILASHVLLLRRLDKLIAVANVPARPPRKQRGRAQAAVPKN